MTLEEGLRAVDGLADRGFPGLKAPAVAYGVVSGGRLVHNRGIGTLRVGEMATPDAASVFRIASMTKSFTAATVLLLRDEGRLRLDDPIGEHVPELTSLRSPTADSPAITIRHLLTMTAGFPTDDPWGDRQQGLDHDRFAELLRGGISFAWTPGLRFEYSNLGYGILGRLITNVAGREYREVVAERLFRPLAMTSTTYLESDVPAARLAHGYLWRDEAWLDEPSDPYGAFAAMGGIFTTVRDLSRWIAGFTDAFPPRDGPESGHPVGRASRREMQQPMESLGSSLTFASADSSPDIQAGGYGYGLFALDHLRWGRIVGHSGGYPGFGSNMRWHPGSGLGVIVLANGRYAPTTALARDMLHALLEVDAAPLRRVHPASATVAARAAVEGLLARWDDKVSARLFAMNVELDEPIARRKATVERLREVHGALRPDPDEQPESQSPFHLAWWLRGERGRVKVEILLSPELPPKVQALTLTSVPEPQPELRAAADRIVSALATVAGASPRWPADVAVGPTVDRDALDRACRATEARFGTVHLGPSIAGDGVNAVTFRLECSRGKVDLRLERDPADGVLTSVALVPVPLAPLPFPD